VSVHRNTSSKACSNTTGMALYPASVRDASRAGLNRRRCSTGIIVCTCARASDVHSAEDWTSQRSTSTAAEDKSGLDPNNPQDSNVMSRHCN
jgi:hypothetical protein